MNTITYKFSKSLITKTIVLFAVLCTSYTFAQETETEQDPENAGVSLGNIEMPNPSSIESKYTYDPFTDRYIYTESVGNFNINYPIILTPEEYQKLVLEESLKSYYKTKIDASDGKKESTKEEQKNLLPEFYIESKLFETIFGGNTIEVTPQGSVEMDLGVLFTRQDNPAFSPRNRSNFTFDFDQRISLSLLGKVGTRLQVTANYDTQSTYNFQNLIKLEYSNALGDYLNSTEDSIIQKIEVGNVNMPLNNSLITGAQSLFGVKTELQFGKTTVTAVFSEQKSETRSVVAQGGGTLQEFDVFIRDYDENRHFFLSQYFRENYDIFLANYPFIANNIQITRIEVWITNRSNTTQNIQNARNLVALQDLGETSELGSAVTVLAGPGALPDNENNAFNPTNVGGGNSQLNDLIRDVATVQSGILVTGVNEGFDYAKLENARKLNQGTEYRLNTQLGYISLNQRLSNDEVLAVAFQYTVGGEVYQVGEFANDGVEATGVDATGPNNIVVENNNLIVKMLKSSITNVDEPVWDLMMKNIYDTGAYQLSQEDFRLNIFYNEAAPLNYITSVDGTGFGTTFEGEPIEETTLLRLFNWDRLNYNSDPQTNGDGFFDFVPGMTVITENGKVIFTKTEPFGRYLFDVLDNDNNPTNNQSDYENDNFNPNQEKYVYDLLYKSTKTAALEEIEKNKFQIKGRYKSQGGDGIPIGSFNVPRGSVTVTAGGRVLVEGVDYTVNYQLGRVQILDEALKASNTPIEISTENNAVFGQQTKRFSGLHVEHKFNDKFVLGATFLNLKERPITQKANYNSEPINNTILGFNGNYSTEVPFLTRLTNKLPNLDTDASSNFSVRGEFAYLLPGAPNATNFNGEATSYVDDFEGSQNAIDLKSPQAWFLSSKPNDTDLGGIIAVNDPQSPQNLENGYNRAMLNWYNIDPIFYSNQRPSGISDDDISGLYTSRVFINEVFPDQDVAQGQTLVLNTLDLAYYPEERGPYNFNPTAVDGVLDSPQDSWAGITRQLTSTDFEQANVEYIEFWLQDPFQDNPANTGGKLVFNLGNISEDVLSDGRKQYENGLPDTSGSAVTTPTSWGNVPASQSLIYAFDTEGADRAAQDVGYDGLSDANEALHANYQAFAGLEDPSNDNYTYYLNTSGDILQRYKRYNGVDGNSPDTFSDTNRGNTTQPDAEDINRDNTMNTINSYFQYELELNRANLPLNDLTEITPANPIGSFIRDMKIRPRNLPNGGVEDVRWYQLRIPVTGDHVESIGGISDFRSIRFVRMYLKEFEQPTVFRFGTLDLVRSDWRRYQLSLQDPAVDGDASDDGTDFSVGAVSLLENEGSYDSPPGVQLEQLLNNNTVIRQNEQSLVVDVCDLESEDSRAVYKNISVDMRQYKKLRMFIHLEEDEENLGTLTDGDLVGFIRMGNDLNDNYYQVEVPLQVSTGTSQTALWPTNNEINIPISALAQAKSIGISNGTLSNPTATFYNIINNELVDTPVGEFTGFVLGQQRVAIKGNPNFGDVRALMVGVKNVSGIDKCGEVWFNELRLSDMDNKGGWAAVVGMDANLADFADVSATGRMSTHGFGGIEQGPNERSREDVKQYDVVTNVNLGQLLPKKWGVQLPFNYGQGVEVITPEYDQQYRDLKLQDRLDAAQTQEEEDIIKEQSESYTKRKSINFIGVRKNRTGNAKPKFYDIENFTFNYSYNKVEHRDFEIENAVDKTVRLGANYAHNFEPLTVEPFKKNDSLFTGKYWKFLKDFNFNLLPTNFTINSDLNRQFNRQKFREIDLGGSNIGLEELFRRNYTFDYQYTINYDLTKSLRLNFTASNNNIVRNYFVDNIINGEQDPTKDVWDGFFDFGDPNRQYQQLRANYELPFNKIPFLSFLTGNYVYTGDFQWQKGSDLFGDIELNGQSYNLGNTIQNANTHDLNLSLNMNNLYKYLGLTKRTARGRGQTGTKPSSKTQEGNTKGKPKKKKNTLLNAGIDILTSIKRVSFVYSENNGTFLPGYLPTPGFIGTLRPTFGYTFGSQRDIRQLAAENKWLTTFPEFNQQYTTTHRKSIDYSLNIAPVRDLKIDLVGTRLYTKDHTENYIVEDINADGVLDYQSLTPNSFGNFNISTIMLKTAFNRSDDNISETFDEFRANRLVIARRLAAQNGVNMTNPSNFENGDVNGFPLGYGKTNQAVLLPAFLSAYTGANSNSISLSTFRDFPIPNWDIKYTGFMKMKWFKKRFKRFSVTHGYRSGYTINQYRTNLDYTPIDFSVSYDNQPQNTQDQAGNYKNETLFSQINLTESFSPLARIDMEMKNSIRILAEVRKDRMLTLSFDNNLMTEILGNEYTLGLGYRIKDLRIKSNLAGPRKTIVSDLNMKLDASVRDNKTIVRYLDLDNSQITAGQTLWNLKFTADYALSKNLTTIFYFDYNFSEYAISTSFPQTTIRSGFTLRYNFGN